MTDDLFWEEHFFEQFWIEWGAQSKKKKKN